ncbi:ATP-dependent protease FtsH [Gordonia hirsuta DSM 44140 = NBRC 16056]|uniref:ATP-dependent zinc metalloprotease FtsH n=1 Tax=Gordonia hirsuta DSM 44140 = NBRC 16056 TaxID=1121927 RepID=L7LFU7_9ACTN|nr:ATP-dependent zinc metalloprotease FtsH [Gordonia hirsuta]GAC58943.1 ATP-dependent protease FtsH [Gordonia hirsuta DSM 44140 = NBRC 16056]
MNRKKLYRNLAIVAVIIFALWGFSALRSDSGEWTGVDTSVAMAQLNEKNTKSIQIDDREQRLRIETNKAVKVDDEDVTKIEANYPSGVSPRIFTAVTDTGAPYQTNITKESGIWQSLIIFVLPMIILFGLFFFVMSRMQGGRGGMMGFGKSKAKQLTKDMPKTTFADVAGADEAVEELDEIRDFLQNPARYQALGAKIPKGVLLFGPPGTGKTLLARAVAGEAGVPFYTISGSDFVEMFVGVGASRVRDLFEQAKANSPCIIFVDEIDAVGRQRGAGMGGGHDEREQTLNQLLVEMDGFGERSGVIVMAATNRPDILDPALLRPGRFDRQIPVGNPDIAGRRAILGVHAKGKPIAPDADLDGLAKRTPGMSGADLANVINEAALLTARENKSVITGELLEEAVDRVIGGPRRKSRVISEHEKKVVAYHEAGHTLAAWGTPDLDPIYKVTILARGRTGGHALAVPEQDKDVMTRSEMIARLVMAMGGRAAEELVFHEPTTGASSDIDQATKIARAMVTEYGMSGRLGAVRYGHEQGDPFMGRGGLGGGTPEYSAGVAAEIDEEVRRLIEAAHTEAWRILDTHRDELDALAAALLERETLVRKDLEEILADVDKRPRMTEFSEFGQRTPSTKPPIKTPGELAIERGEPWPPVPEPVPVGAQPVESTPYPVQPHPTQPQYPSPAQQYPGQQPPPAGYPYPNEPVNGSGQPPAGPQPGGQHQAGHPQQPGQPPYGQPQQPGQPPYGPPSGEQPQYGRPYPGPPQQQSGGTWPDYGAPRDWQAPGWPPADDPRNN